MNPLTKDILSIAPKLFVTSAQLGQELKAWLVFLLCLAFSVVGVVISFAFFGTTITGVKRWGIVFVISVFMVGINYAVKYANPHTRVTFTTIEVI